MAPKVRKPIQSRGIVTKQKLIDVGLKLFSESGFHGTSSKQIAKAAGVSTGIFYNYFKDKKDLFLNIFEDHVGEIHEKALDLFRNSNWQDTGGREMVGKIIKFSRESHKINSAFHKEMTKMKDSDEDISNSYHREINRLISEIIEILKKKKDILRVTDLEAAGRVVILTLEEVIHSVALNESPIEEERVLDSLSDMLCRYLFI